MDIGKEKGKPVKKGVCVFRTGVHQQLLLYCRRTYAAEDDPPNYLTSDEHTFQRAIWGSDDVSWHRRQRVGAVLLRKNATDSLGVDSCNCIASQLADADVDTHLKFSPSRFFC